MDSADDLLGGLASGGGDSAPQTAPLQPLKRDPDSTDDFEHLQESPVHASRAATQSFLDMERDLFETPRAPSAADRLDHLADKFTDSESDADTAESPMHRPAPTVPATTAAAPAVSAHEAAPLLAPFADKPAPAPPTPEPASTPEPVKPASVPVEPPKPAPAPVELPKPAPAPVEPPKPAPIEQVPKPAPVETTKPAPAPVQPSKPAPVTAPQPSAPRPSPPQPVQVRAPVAHVIEAEVIFCQMGLVESLIYWRAPARSGAALGAGLALLVALACCSVVSVLAYASLLALTAAVAFRIYKSVLQAVQKTNDGHPFKWLLEAEISVPAERAQELAASATAHLNVVSNELRRLFLVEDLVDSLKFGVLLWCLTYVGACFNGITLIILGWIALFTLPKAYEMNKAQVDANLELVRAKIDEISTKVRAAVPLGKKAESEKDK